MLNSIRSSFKKSQSTTIFTVFGLWFNTKCYKLYISSFSTLISQMFSWCIHPQANQWDFYKFVHYFETCLFWHKSCNVIIQLTPSSLIITFSTTPYDAYDLWRNSQTASFKIFFAHIARESFSFIRGEK